MGLFVDLRITARTGSTRHIGFLEIVRKEHLHNFQDPNDEEHPYVVRVYDDEMRLIASSSVKHRYGDGAWMLVAKAMEALDLNTSVNGDFQPKVKTP